jgi:hypothetical protein
MASTSLALAIFAVTALGQRDPADTPRSEGRPARATSIAADPGGVLKTLAVRSSPSPAVGLANGVRNHHVGEVHFDVPGDGAIWVRGESYKASFGTEGATLIPFLGTDAPANRPLRLSPESVTIGGKSLAFEDSVPATREGLAIAFDRGSFVEKYDITSTAIEQTFVFAAVPARGDLVLRLQVQTDLERASTSDAGLRFACERGGVTYGRATALDAGGRTAPIEREAGDGFIELRVPASFLETATLPLTIDPVITTFTVGDLSMDDYTPDVAYDPSTGRYMICYEEAFSATDHDVFEELLTVSGALISSDYIDYTTSNWQHPRVANNARASQFMVVAQVGAAPVRAITSRVVAAGTGALGAQVLVNQPNNLFDQVNPDIGGNPGTDPDSLYLVVWEFVINSSGERDIVQTGMHTTGLPDGFAPTCIDCGGGRRNYRPAISKSCGSTQGLYNVWNVVWEYEFSTADHDIYGIQQANELALSNPYPIDTSTDDDRRPTVSSFAEGSNVPGNYLVAYDRDYGVEHDILAQVMHGSSSVAFGDLSYLEGPTYNLQDQLAPSADSDGCTFAVAYSELYSTSPTDYDAYIATFNLVGNTIDCIEPHQNLGFTGLPERDLRITATRGGPPLNYFAAWTLQVPTNYDIYGGRYVSPLIVPYCTPGSDGVAACPCNNPSQGSGGCNNSIATGGAILYGAGTPLLSADSFVLGQQGELASSLSIFLQGTANTMAGVTFGDGVRCVSGTLKRLYVHNASAGGVIAPTGADAAVTVRSAALGDTIHACQTRYYQVYYRDANLSFCAGGFNVGNGLKVTWLP